MEASFLTLKQKYFALKKQIISPCELLVVSKNRSVAEIEFLYHCGQKDFGENKVQELIQKSHALAALDIQWHFIGHLQTNKIKNLLKVVGLKSIHSIDSAELFYALLKETENKKLRDGFKNKIGLFWQINTSNENEKHGFSKLEEIIPLLSLLQNNAIFFNQGLMTMSAIRTENYQQSAQASFHSLKQCAEELIQLHQHLYFAHHEIQLSMGMSDDYQWAMELGAHWVRIGSKIFSPSPDA